MLSQSILSGILAVVLEANHTVFYLVFKTIDSIKRYEPLQSVSFSKDSYVCDLILNASTAFHNELLTMGQINSFTVSAILSALKTQTIIKAMQPK